MSSLKLRFPAIDSTTNVGSVFGGITAYWTEEGAELAESQGAFQAIGLEAWKLTALATVTNELVRDAAGGFNIYLEQLFPAALSYFEDLAFLKGNGVGQPLGVLNTNNQALVTVSKESSQAADTIVWNNILKMYARMLPTSLSKAVWLVTPEALPQLANMTVAVKNVAGTENVGGSAVWLTDGTGAPTLTLLGRPVIITEKAGLLGDLGDIAFVDLSMYLIGDRQQMTMDSSAHAKFTSDKTVYRIIERVDGRPWVNSAITPQNGGPTLSPFVQLEAR
jgi:HK97 family phage major capsid protein